MKINGSKRKVMHLLAMKMFDDDENEAVQEPESVVESENKGNGPTTFIDFIKNNIERNHNEKQEKNPFPFDSDNDDPFKIARGT